MRTRITAAACLVLVLPAALFMTALALRSLQPQQHEPARAAQQLVMWYAARMWTLWALLLGLPLIAFVVGCVELLRGWRPGPVLPLASRKPLASIRARLASLFIGATTMLAGVILAIVILHMLAN